MRWSLRIACDYIVLIHLSGVAVVWWGARECRAWSWIVASTPGGDSVSENSPPTCPSYCLNALSGNVDARIPVGLWWCQGTRFPNERWSYDSATAALSLTNADGTAVFCLDIADEATSANLTGSSGLNGLVLSNCTRGSVTQRWNFEAATHRLQSSAGPNSSYVRAYRPAGQSDYYLYVTENATSAQSFIMVDSSVMGTYYTPTLPANNESNLILNGNLELLTSFASLGIPLQYTLLPNQQLVSGFDFVLCHWSVQGDLSFGNCSSAKCQLPQEWCGSGNIDENLVFLNWLERPPPARQGGVMQTVPTYPGANYLLLFDMRNPYKQTQSLQLSVSPTIITHSTGSSTVDVSSKGFQILSNQTESQTHQFRFTASGNFVNVSFSSQDSTQCGPLINNIQLYVLSEETSQALTVPPPSPKYNRELLAIALVGFLVGCGVTTFYLAAKWRRRRKSRMGTVPSSSPIVLQHQITVYSYEELREYTEDFSVFIGEGGFGKVYFGRLPESGQRIAVKRQNAADDTLGFQAELELLSRVHHRYIVKFLGYCDEKGERMLVFEYMPNKSLYSRLHVESGGLLSWASRLRIAYQVAYALEYLHHGANPPVLHRDVKSANVLLADTLAAKLADLGISKVGRLNDATHWTSTMTIVKGSRGYLDPYYLQTSMISEKSDVYSFGVLLLELLTGRKAITADSELLTAWVKQVYWEAPAPTNAAAAAAWEEPLLDATLRGTVGGSEVEAIMEIARCCLHEEPRHRPSMVEVARRLRDQMPAQQHAGHDDEANFGFSTSTDPGAAGQFSSARYRSSITDTNISCGR